MNKFNNRKIWKRTYTHTHNKAIVYYKKYKYRCIIDEYIHIYLFMYKRFFNNNLSIAPEEKCYKKKQHIWKNMFIYDYNCLCIIVMILDN